MPAEHRGNGPHPSRMQAYPARLLAWADLLQRRHRVLAFPWAVVKKYGEDAGGRHAALITYYGFLSIFPLLLVAVSVLTTVLVDHPKLRADMVEALVPPSLQETVNTSLSLMPSSGLPLLVGVLGLLFAGTGVVVSSYETLNHLAGVPVRERFGFFSRYARVLLMLVVLLTAGLLVAALTVATAVLPDLGQLQWVSATVSTAVVVFVVLIAAAKVLVARRVSWRGTWLAAAGGSLAVTIVLSAGASLLSGLVSRAGLVYGSFATVVGSFALLYLVSQALLYSAEAATVRRHRLWPRALDLAQPAPADHRALSLLAAEQERLAGQRIDVSFEPTVSVRSQVSPPLEPPGGEEALRRGEVERRDAPDDRGRQRHVSRDSEGHEQPHHHRLGHADAAGDGHDPLDQRGDHDHDRARDEADGGAHGVERRPEDQTPGQLDQQLGP